MDTRKLQSRKTRRRRLRFAARQTSVRHVDQDPVSSRAESNVRAEDRGRNQFDLELRSRSPKNRNQKPCYRLETLRPIVCLSFIAPLLFFYEIGSIFLDDVSGKSGIDQWMHRMLESIGFGQLVILPILTAALLIAWHHRINDSWKLCPTVLIGMGLESVGLGLILFFAANAFYQMMTGEQVQFTLAIQLGNANLGWWSNTISYVGCGVYEELVFRLIMLNALILAMNRYWGLDRAGKIIGMLATSLLFAALHYDFFNPAGSEFEMSSFMFRLLASMIFCVLFLFRGFGIAVGTHAIYDVLTQI